MLGFGGGLGWWGSSQDLPLGSVPLAAGTSGLPCMYVYGCVSPAVYGYILELFPVAARTKTRDGSAPPFGAASRDNGAEMG